MFVVRSDRSGLIDRDDAGGDAAVLSQWNLQLKSDLVAPLIAAALEWIARSADSTSASFYPAYFKLWPLGKDMEYVHQESSRLLSICPSVHLAHSKENQCFVGAIRTPSFENLKAQVFELHNKYQGL